MAKKNRIPKTIAGVKVPKALRRSKMLGYMVASDVGRDMLANALTAGAGAAAVVLTEHRDEIGETARTTTKQGTKALGLASEAVQSGFSAAMDVIKETVLPHRQKNVPHQQKKKISRSKSSSKRAGLH